MMLDDDATSYLRLRRATSAMSSTVELEPEGLRVEERRLRARYGHGPEMLRETCIEPEGHIPRHVVLRPTAAPIGVLVYFHGGGWVFGEPEDYLAVCRTLAAASNWSVIVADYRKAPENPFPAAFDDCLALVEHVLARDESGGDGALPVAIAGDSAGGNLCAAVAAEVSRARPGALAAQVLITPVLDSDLDTTSYLDAERQLSLTRDAMAWFWDQYASVADRGSPRAAPLKGDNFAALPETLFVSVLSDVLHTEGERYLERLRTAGVTVRRREFSGQMHGFFQLIGVMAAAETAVRWIARELSEIAELHGVSAVERGERSGKA